MISGVPACSILKGLISQKAECLSQMYQGLSDDVKADNRNLKKRQDKPFSKFSKASFAKGGNRKVPFLPDPRRWCPVPGNSACVWWVQRVFVVAVVAFWYSQSKSLFSLRISGDLITEEDLLLCFGSLCLISRAETSHLLRLLVKTKSLFLRWGLTKFASETENDVFCFKKLLSLSVSFIWVCVLLFQMFLLNGKKLGETNENNWVKIFSQYGDV